MRIDVSITLFQLLPTLVTAGARVIDVKRTYGIFGKIQNPDKDKIPTIELLLQQCFSGFALNSCKDLNVSAGYKRDYDFALQFTDPSLSKQQYCLQCCTKPVPRLTGADETWNLTCPLNDLQRLSVSQGERVFRFARRNTLDDDGMIQCRMPNRTDGTYLSGYYMLVWVEEHTSSYGSEYWRSVINCTVSITEAVDPPETFSEVIRIRSVPIDQERPTNWIVPTLLALGGILLIVAVPVYHAVIQKQRCVHCGSWIVIINSLCIVCICISCSIRPPPVKVYAASGLEPPKKTKSPRKH